MASTLLAALAWGVAGVAGLLVVLLFVPVRLQARLSRDPARFRLRFGLFWGLVRLTLVDTGRPKALPKTRRDLEPEASTSSKSATPRRNARRTGGRRRPWRALIRAGFEALSVIRVERFEGIIAFGLGDPASTGEAFGRAMGLVAATPCRGRVQLVPVFDRVTLEGDGILIVSLIPARLIPVAARLGWAMRPRRLSWGRA
ncbi:hypothetical protein JI664_06950 [Rhodobacter sp. NTK016B]|uniref:hypothetical protein n=1 Tax=Rhodobacter sp. NTK016B TaxID=2759676 RepID=UPI001A8EA586|nr:hypothetical protein [Rhodobacter sp. NTK016B]MBN8291696.1 hypothetical protein [Rhodobacter sp. NTK016B]